MLEQEGYQFYNDDGSQASATTKAAQDAAISIALDTPVRLRVLVNSSAITAVKSVYRLEYKEAAQTDYSPVVTSGGNIIMALSSNITASGESTTARMTAPSGKSAGGDFVAGLIWDDENGADTITSLTAASKYTELEWCIQANSSFASLAQTYSFRVTRQAFNSGGVAPSVLQSPSSTAGGEGSTQTVAFTSSVVSGNLIVVGAFTFTSGAHGPLAAAMCTKSAGTATIGTVTLDEKNDRVDGSNSNLIGLWSVPVTGTGTLTMQVSVASIAVGSVFMCIGQAEVSNVDISATRVNATATTAASTNTTIASGNVATGGAGILFGVCAPGSPYGTITLTEDGAFTKIVEAESDAQENGALIYRAVTSDTTDSADWTAGTACAWTALEVAYKSSSP